MKHRLTGASRTVAAAAATVAALIASPTDGARAQQLTSTTTDATVLRQGEVRARALTAWTLYDRLYGIPGSARTTPLGALFSADSLGANHIRGFDALEARIGELTGAGGAPRLTAGALSTSARVRIVVVPLLAEVGVTDRLTVGVMAPVVQSRASSLTFLNPAAAHSANVGPNPFAFFGSESARASNTSVFDALTAAGSQLSARIASCDQNPLDPTCAPVLLRRAEAVALVNQSAQFVQAASPIYGIGAELPGEYFVPIAGTPVQASIDQRLEALRTSYASFDVAAGSGAIAAAGGPATFVHLQRILSEPRFGMRRDTIGVAERIEMGDVELSATLQLANTFPDTASEFTGLRMRSVAQAIVRLGTGRPARPNTLFDVGSGDGQTDLELRGALDLLMSPRWMASFVGGYVAQFGTTPPVITGVSPFPLSLGPELAGSGPGIQCLRPNTSEPCSPRYGNVIDIAAIPRLSLTRYLTLTGGYAFRHQAVRDAVPSFVTGWMSHSAGLGFSYSGTREGGGTRGLPVEVAFSRFRTLHVSGGPAPAASRDQMELRYYFGGGR